MGNHPAVPVEVEDDGKRLSTLDKLEKSAFYPHLSELRVGFSGVLLTPDQKEPYTAARSRPYNKDSRGYPLVIARPKSTEDVSRVIKFVRMHGKGLALCVEGGGHSHKCMEDNSIVLDLELMNSTEVNVNEQTIVVGGGAYLEAVDRALEPYHLVVPVGTFPLTGVGGLTLAGGFGWTSRFLGTTSDNFIEAEVVLSDGRVVKANDSNEHADLMKGLRGGGGNFGVVTSFKFQAHKLPTHCYCGKTVFIAPTRAAKLEILRNYDALVQTLPNNTTSALVFSGGAPVVPIIWAHYGEEATLDDVQSLKSVKSLGGWVTFEYSIRERSHYSDVQTMTQPFKTSGHIYTSFNMIGSTDRPLPPACFENMVDFTSKALPSTILKADCLFFQANSGKFTPTVPTSMDPASRESRYYSIVEAKWKPEAGQKGKEDARNWCKTVIEILRKYDAFAIYAPDAVNSAVVDESGISQLVSAEGSNAAQLRALKTKYDPDNFFRMNSNILPQK